jgi:hypothetical protein
MVNKNSIEIIITNNFRNTLKLSLFKNLLLFDIIDYLVYSNLNFLYYKLKYNNKIIFNNLFYSKYPDQNISLAELFDNKNTVYIEQICITNFFNENEIKFINWINYNNKYPPEKNSIYNESLIFDAISLGYSVLSYISNTIITKDIVLYAVKIDGLEILNAKMFTYDRDVIIEAVSNNAYVLNYIDDIYKNDYVICKYAVENNPCIFKHLSYSIKNSSDFILDCINNDHSILQYVGIELKCNYWFIYKVLKINGMELNFVGNSFKDDDIIVLTAVRSNGLALQYASKRIKDTKTIVKIAIENDPLSLQFASDNLKNDIDIVSIAINLNHTAITYVGDKIKYDKTLLLSFIKKSTYYYSNKLLSYII